MATDKTPTHKRIQRAEEGREQWKAKALLRREEIVKLKIDLKLKDDQLLTLRNMSQNLKSELIEAKKKIDVLEKNLETKKKLHRNL